MSLTSAKSICNYRGGINIAQISVLAIQVHLVHLIDTKGITACNGKEGALDEFLISGLDSLPKNLELLTSGHHGREWSTSRTLHDWKYLLARVSVVTNDVNTLPRRKILTSPQWYGNRNAHSGTDQVIAIFCRKAKKPDTRRGCKLE